MTDNYENGYQAGRFDGYVEAMDLARDDAAELRAALRQLLAEVEGTDGHMGLIDVADKYYGPFDEAEAAIARATAVLAAHEGQP